MKLEVSDAETLTKDIIHPYLTEANPASGSVGIRFTNESGRYSVAAYDIRGGKVEEWSGNGRDVFIDWDVNASSIASGIYLIKVDTGDNVSVLKTVITR